MYHPLSYPLRSLVTTSLLKAKLFSHYDCYVTFVLNVKNVRNVSSISSLPRCIFIINNLYFILFYLRSYMVNVLTSYYDTLTIIVCRMIQKLLLSDVIYIINAVSTKPTVDLQYTRNILILRF